MRTSRLGMWTLSLFCLVMGGPLGGCSHNSVAPSTSVGPAAESGGADYSSPPRAYDQADSAGRGAAAPSSVAPETPADIRAKAERPGLGTSFGESRYSPVHDVPFERQNESPTFLASLHYNDGAGVDAMRSRLGRLVSYRSGEPVFRAFAASSRAPERYWGGVTLQVVDEGGRALPAYHVDGRVILVGEHGRRYALEVHNRTPQRFEIVASVDGLDVIDGKSASLDKRGYVVAPYGHLRIDGYRRNMSEVAAFRFGTVRDSYAAQTAESGDRNVGVIGMALFAERGSTSDYFRYNDPDLDEEARRRDQADPFPGRFAQPPPSRYNE